MTLLTLLLAALAAGALPPGGTSRAAVAPRAAPQGGGRIEVIEERYADGTPKLRREVRRDKDGIINHGLYESWHPNGRIALRGRALDGQWDGPVVEYYITGVLKEETEYRRGVLHGKHHTFWRGGQPKLVEIWKDGKLHGPFEQYGFGPLRKSEEGAYVEGDKQGRWKEFDVSGTVVSEGEFERGRKQGPWVRRDAEGRTVMEENYADGALDGVWREYGADGTLIAEAHYVAGKAEGVRTEWYPSGHKKSESEHAGGLPNGRWSVWFETGAKQIEGRMTEGKRNGRWTYWNPDGTINAAWSGLYEDDKRVGD